MDVVSIKTRFFYSLVFLLVVILLNNFLFKSMFWLDRTYAQLMNTAEKQRMLSQKIMLNAIQYEKKQSNKVVQELRNMCQEMQQNAAFVQEKIDDAKITQLLKDFENTNHLQTFIATVEHFLQIKDKKALENLRLQSEKLLKINELKVSKFEEYFSSRVAMMWYLNILFSISYIVLIAFMWFKIFKPTIEKMDFYFKELKKQKQEFQTVLETAVDGIAIMNLESKFLYVNEAYTQITGYSKSELLQTSCLKLTDPNDKAGTRKILKAALLKGAIKNFQKTCINKEGTKIVVTMSLALMPDRKRFVVSINDVTKLKAKEHQINEYVKLINENVITATTDLYGYIIYVSKAFEKISGYKKYELLGKSHQIISKNPEIPSGFDAKIWQQITNDKMWQGEIKKRKKDGSVYWIEASIHPIYDAFGVKKGYTAIYYDITDKKRIEELSITDGLTNIYNRRHFNTLFPKLINAAKRHHQILCFVMVDIDHFKDYNDMYGHQKGDEALINVARVMQQSLKRAEDYCFRLGGEEFGIIFNANSKQSAVAFAKRITKAIEDLKIAHEKNSASRYLSVSTGLLCKDTDAIESIEKMYKECDALLYEAKKRGRNQVVANC
jgi:diguanylate cyclase (GGDEF)-like protein/PAS domain S-box-containing protein